MAKIISVEINYNFIDKAYIDFTYKLPGSNPKIEVVWQSPHYFNILNIKAIPK